MRRAALLLPIFLLCEALAEVDGRLAHSNMASDQPCSSRTTTEANRGLPDALWRSFGSFLSKHLPGDASAIEPGFFSDLRIAFNFSQQPPARQHEEFIQDDEDDTCYLQKRDFVHPRDDQTVLKTKCRVKPRPHQEWDGDIPNYTPTDSNGRPLPTQTIGDGHGGGGQEIISVQSLCGTQHSGATVATNTSTGPNGSFTWLTCGIDPNNNSTGWQPPFATVDQIITYPGGLKAAVQADNSIFAACSKFVELFETAGAEFQIPPLYIASFALQESGCDPNAEGGGGEQGMMQISPEKCVNAPDGDCKNVVYNVRTAVSYFRDVLLSVNNNTFEAVGNYNGWYRGMTYKDATQWGQNGDCCRCQQNLSYLSQFFNGWLQGIDGWNPPLGSIHNTAICTD